MEFKVGQFVVDSLYGFGEIVEIDLEKKKPIIVRYEKCIWDVEYSSDGRFSDYEEEPLRIATELEAVLYGV